MRRASPQRATFSCAFEDLIESVTRGNPTEVKVILASERLEERREFLEERREER